jgi:uncharacterized protein (DUF58 family)
MLTVRESRQLDRLTFGACAAVPVASASGLRTAQTRGSGLEFHDYRGYQPGDDPRRIEWTVHARLQQLVVRVYRADAHLRVHILVDATASMRIGTPEKLTCAKKVAAALAYIAVKQRDAVGVAAFQDRLRGRVTAATGQHQLQHVFQTLEAVTPEGQATLDAALRDYGATIRAPGLVIVVSDFFHDGDIFQGLRHLLHRGLTPVLVQVVAPEELAPDFDEANLLDIEDPGASTVAADGRTIALYRQRVAEHAAGLRAFCHAHGLAGVQLPSSCTFTELLQRSVQSGLLAAQGSAGRA